VCPHDQRFGPEPGDFGLVQQRREQGRGGRLIGGGGQRCQRDQLVDEGQLPVEGQRQLRAKLIPTVLFPLAQRLQQRLPNRSARRACGDVFVQGALLARAGWPWGRGWPLYAQQRVDVDEQRFRVRRII
jgi:hypothetical protein